MYLGYQDGKAKFYTEEKLDLEMYDLEKVKKVNKEYVLIGDEYVLKTKAIMSQQDKENRIAEILNELNEIDFKTIRALRINEKDKLKELEAQAEELREELKGLK